MAKVKEFIQRHSFILVIVVALFVALTNFLVYPVFINKQLNLTEVPICLLSVEENQIITPEVVSTISIDTKFLPDNIIIDKNEIIGKYVKKGCKVPSQGFFYSELLTDAQTALGTAFANLKDGEFAYTLSLTDAYKSSKLFKINQTINVYYYEEYVNEEGTKSYLAGQIAENRRVVDIVEDDKGLQSFVTIALSEEEIANFLLAEQYGFLVPALNWQSNGLDFTPTTYYNIPNLNAHLVEMSQVFNNVELPEEETEITEQTTIEQPEQIQQNPTEQEVPVE